MKLTKRHIEFLETLLSLNKDKKPFSVKLMKVDIGIGEAKVSNLPIPYKVFEMLLQEKE